MSEEYSVEEIGEDFNKITNILNKHNKIIAYREHESRLLGNGELMDNAEDNEVTRPYSIYKSNELSANYLLKYMEKVVQPALQEYVSEYINHFSKEANRDAEKDLFR